MAAAARCARPVAAPADGAQIAGVVVRPDRQRLVRQLGPRAHSITGAQLLAGAELEDQRAAAPCRSPAASAGRPAAPARRDGGEERRLRGRAVQPHHVTGLHVQRVAAEDPGQRFQSRSRPHELRILRLAGPAQHRVQQLAGAEADGVVGGQPGLVLGGGDRAPRRLVLVQPVGLQRRPPPPAPDARSGPSAGSPRSARAAAGSAGRRACRCGCGPARGRASARAAPIRAAGRG